MVLTSGSMFQGYHTLVPDIYSNSLEMIWVPLIIIVFMEQVSEFNSVYRQIMLILYLFLVQKHFVLSAANHKTQVGLAIKIFSVEW